MISIVISTIYPGIPKAQLFWLSKQTCQDFELILLDGYFQSRQELSEYADSLGFGSRFKHLPLLEQTNVAKQIDYTARNNGCLLASYDQILMLDDYEYYHPNLVEMVVSSRYLYHYFYVNDLSPEAFYPSDWSVDLEKTYKRVVTTADDISDAPIVKAPDDRVDATFVWNHNSFSRERFIYEFNGVDEAATAAYAWDDNEIGIRRAKRNIEFERHFSVLYHFDHAKNVRSLRTPRPCCLGSDFPISSINSVRYRDMFQSDAKIVFYDEHGYEWFRCTACGFSGPVDGEAFLEQRRKDSIIKAAVGWSDGRLGRNLIRLFEDLKNLAWTDKLNLIETSYQCKRYYEE